jgi:hypothetical protein
VREISGGADSLSRIFSALHDEGLFVDMISQTGFISEKTNVSFTVADEASSRALEVVRGLVGELRAGGASVDRDIAKRQAASRYLHALVDLGILEEKSVGKEKVFMHPRLLKLLSDDSHRFKLYE